MNLANDRFYKSNCTFIKKVTKEKVIAPVYTYETKTKLFDVLVYENSKFVRVNMGPWSNIIDHWEPIHYAIEKHFKL